MKNLHLCKITGMITCFYFLSGCVENLNLGNCNNECPLNQTCVGIECGCAPGTEMLFHQCFSANDGLFIGTLPQCIGKIGFGLPEGNRVRYRLDSSGEGWFDGLTEDAGIYFLHKFYSCSIRDTVVYADIFLKFGERNSNLQVKALWRAIIEEPNAPIIEEENVVFNLPK